MKGIVAALLCSAILFYACGGRIGKEAAEDYFYTDAGFEQKRIPLVKPYEALCWDSGWFIRTETVQLLEISIHDVRSLNVEDSVVLVHASGNNVSVRHAPVSEAWFILDPVRRKELAFTDKKKFIQWLRSKGIRNVETYNVDTVYNKFQDFKRKINWAKDFK